MDLQVIVSTMNNDFENLDNSLKEYNNLIVINQIPKECNGKTEVKDESNKIWINYDQIGLSRSRNLGLKVATSDYLYLTDDDIVLNDSLEDIVRRSISKYPNVDIFAFQVNGINRKFKTYSPKPTKIGYIKSLNLSSVQLIIKTSFIENYSLNYDVDFGTGSIYSMGEENIFLFDALKRGAKIQYVPEEIARVYLDDSTWFTGFNEKYFFDRGAIYQRMFKKKSSLFSFSFCLKKRKLYKKNMSFFKAFQSTQRGKQSYLNYSRESKM